MRKKEIKKGMNPKGKGKRPSPAIISLHCDRERCLLQQVNTEQEEEAIFPTSPFPTSKICWDTEMRNRQRKKSQESHWCLAEALKSQWLAEERCLMDILGRERLRKKLRTKRNKNEHEAQNSGSQATALAPQMDLFGEASRGGGKGISSLGSVECKEERRQVG